MHQGTVMALALGNSLIGTLHPLTCMGETIMRIARSAADKHREQKQLVNRYPWEFVRKPTLIPTVANLPSREEGRSKHALLRGAPPKTSLSIPIAAIVAGLKVY